MNSSLKKYFKTKNILIEKTLRELLPKSNSILSSAMAYSLLAGGKRLRPILALLAAESCGKDSRRIVVPACAIEFIHTYSLIHDDLPAMDDDDLRRGKATCHIKFSDAAAILAGDALLTDAFEIITAQSKYFEPQSLIRALNVLARAAGSSGMVLGQALDTLEAGSWKNKSTPILVKKLNTIHLNKTAALIKASLELGAILSGANDRQIISLGRYGEMIGLAFQISDDILDRIGSKKLLGKKGSDIKNNKLTYPALYGLDASGVLARLLVRKAKDELAIFGKKGILLSQLADYIVSREK